MRNVSTSDPSIATPRLQVIAGIAQMSMGKRFRTQKRGEAPHECFFRRDCLVCVFLKHCRIRVPWGPLRLPLTESFHNTEASRCSASCLALHFKHSRVDWSTMAKTEMGARLCLQAGESFTLRVGRQSMSIPYQVCATSATESHQTSHRPGDRAHFQPETLKAQAQVRLPEPAQGVSKRLVRSSGSLRQSFFYSCSSTW